MKYKLDILPRAIDDIRAIAEWWSQHRSTEQAGRWLSRIESAIAGLAVDPDKHPAATESDQFTFELQELRFGLRNSKTHRVVFAIRGNTVRIYTVRHLAQDFLTQEDIETIE